MVRLPEEALRSVEIAWDAAFSFFDELSTRFADLDEAEFSALVDEEVLTTW